MKRDISKGKLHLQVDMKSFTSWHIGGCAEKLYWPENLANLQKFLSQQSLVEPLLFLGLGSNILVADEGIAGTVIITQGVLHRMSVNSDSTVRIEAGVSCA